MLPDGVRYCPFPGRVVDHPSVLLGTIDEIAADAERLTALDHVTGLDLLAYRHPTADHVALIREVVRRSSGPVIVAGSIASIDRARRGQRGRRVGIHHRQRHLRRPAARRAVHRRAGPSRPRGDGVGRRCIAAKPGRRLGGVPGRTLLADRLRDELLEEITSSQLQPGTKLPTEGELAEALQRISGHGARSGAGAGRGRLRHPSSRFGQLCRRASADAARTRLDAELSRDDRECGRPCRDAGARRGVRAVLARTTAPCNSARATRSWRSSGCGRPTTSR